MRVFPTFGRLKGNDGISARSRADVIVPVFRSIAAAWIAAKYPSHGTELRKVAGTAATATARAIGAAAFFAANWAGGSAAPRAATDAAARAAAAAEDLATLGAAIFADAAVSFSIAATAAVSFSWGAIAAAAADAEFIVHAGTVAEMIELPLWPQGEPDWSKQLWTNLKSVLPADEHWDVWTRWWEPAVTASLRSRRWNCSG